MLANKCELVDIEMILTEESYTSKCSFLDLEPIQKQDVDAGRRVKRGLFVSSSGVKINADVNGPPSIIRKVIPNAFSQGIAAFGVSPCRFSLRP